MRHRVVADTGHTSKVLPWEIVIIHGENLLSDEGIEFLKLKDPLKLKEYGINNITIYYPDKTETYGQEIVVVPEPEMDHEELPTVLEDGPAKDIAHSKSQQDLDKVLATPRILKMPVSKAEKTINKSENILKLKQLYHEMLQMPTGKPYADITKKRILELNPQEPLE